MAVEKPVFKDWLVMRLWGRASEGIEICVLTTRKHLLSRHYRFHLRKGIHDQEANKRNKIPGLRRYKTESGAKLKAAKLNNLYETSGYRAIREDAI